MKITCLDRTMTLPDGWSAGRCLEAFGALDAGVLAAMVGEESADLITPVAADAVLRPLTYRDEEGRRTYERTLRFVLLIAAERLWPGCRVRVEYSVSSGVLARLLGRDLSAGDVAQLERAMRAVVAEDLPFEKKRWSRAAASVYFEWLGQTDKVDLLRLRPYDFFDMYTCGGIREYFYGVMAPSTGSVAVFSLRPHEGGFVLLLPDQEDPAKVGEYHDRPKHLKAFAQSAEWCRILGVNNVADLVRLTQRHELRQFIRVNEVLHDLAMGDVAREIVRRGRRIILVAGPSSSGKTTFSGRMTVQLQVHGVRARRISLDDYYIDRDRIPPEPDGTVDLENLNTIDVPLIQRQVRELLEGKQVIIPHFDFQTQRRAAEGTPVALGPDEAIVFEGIHALNPALSAGMPEDAIHRIFVSDLTCLNLDDRNRIRTTDIRLLRRIVRDHQFRGTSPEETLAMWPSVRRGEERWIFPYQEQADSVFNTALHYEMLVLRHFAYDLLERVPKTSPGYVGSRRLLKMLHYVPDIDPAILEEIPPLSLLREFIGGCTMEEK